jgi:hypothetical protein
VTYENVGFTDFSGLYGIVLVDDNDNIIQVISNRGTSTLPAGYFTTNLSITCAVPSSISPGDYKIRAAIKPTNGDWMIVEGTPGSIDILPLNVKDEAIETSINDVSVSSFTLYPNPVKDILSVSGEESIIQSVKITDLSGRTVKSILCKMKQVDIPVNDLTPGYYLVTVQTGNNVITEKIIKN